MPNTNTEGQIHWGKFTHLGNNIHEIHAFQERIREDGGYAFEPNPPLAKLIMEPELVDMDVSFPSYYLVLWWTKKAAYADHLRTVFPTRQRPTEWIPRTYANFHSEQTPQIPPPLTMYAPSLELKYASRLVVLCLFLTYPSCIVFVSSTPSPIHFYASLAFPFFMLG